MKSLANIALLASLLSAPAVAQDLRRIEPQSPQPLSFPRTSAAMAAADAARGPVLPNLRGLVFLSHPSQLNEPAALDGHRLDTTRLPFLATEEFAGYVSQWWSKPISERSVQSLLAAINLYYAGKDRPFVSVSVPNQDISSGVLRILVVEGRLSELRVAGNRWFEEEAYRRDFGLQAGEVLQKSRIDAGLDWIARSNPFRAATVVARPGDGFGSTDLELQIREREPLRWYSGANNYGTESTDYERLVFGSNWGRAFGRDHQLNAQVSASPDFHKSLGVSANYTMPLSQWRHLVHISAAWSRINADVPADFDSRGESWQLLTAYEVPFSPRDNLRHGLRLGFDFKRSDNNLEFGGIPVTDNVTEVVQLSLAWQGSIYDPLGRTSLNARLVLSPGELSSNNDDEAFAASRWGSSADYRYGRIDLQRYTPLPAGFEWRAALAWQESSENLLGSEQLGLSGSGAVRGYRENDLYADEGWLLRNEVALPAVSLLKMARFDTASDDHLQFHLFYDYGRGNSVERLLGEPSRLSIDSAGLGARYRLSEKVSAIFEYGWQGKAMPGEDRDQRGHLSLMVTF